MLRDRVFSDRAVSAWTDGDTVTKDVKDVGHSAVRGNAGRALFGAREYWAAKAKENSSAPDLGWDAVYQVTVREGGDWAGGAGG